MKPSPLGRQEAKLNDSLKTLTATATPICSTTDREALPGGPGTDLGLQIAPFWSCLSLRAQRDAGFGLPPQPPPAPSAPQVPAGPGWCVELPCPSPSPSDLCFYHHHKQRHRHSSNLTNFCESVMSLQGRFLAWGILQSVRALPVSRLVVMALEM